MSWIMFFLWKLELFKNHFLSSFKYGKIIFASTSFFSLSVSFLSFNTQSMQNLSSFCLCSSFHSVCIDWLFLAKIQFWNVFKFSTKAIYIIRHHHVFPITHCTCKSAFNNNECWIPAILFGKSERQLVWWCFPALPLWHFLIQDEIAGVQHSLLLNADV